MFDTKIVIQVIASTMSLLGIVLGIFFTWKANKRSKYIEIITNQTIKNMLFLRENASCFSALTRPEIINSDAINNYKFQLMQASVNIESIMKYRFDKEREIINIVRRMTKLALRYYDKPNKEIEKDLKLLNEKFYMLISVYDYSDWQYIKAQVKTRPFKEFPDYDVIYAKQKKLFEDSNKPIKW